MVRGVFSGRGKKCMTHHYFLKVTIAKRSSFSPLMLTDITLPNFLYSWKSPSRRLVSEIKTQNKNTWKCELIWNEWIIALFTARVLCLFHAYSDTHHVSLSRDTLMHYKKIFAVNADIVKWRAVAIVSLERVIWIFCINECCRQRVNTALAPCWNRSWESLLSKCRKNSDW